MSTPVPIAAIHTIQQAVREGSFATAVTLVEQLLGDSDDTHQGLYLAGICHIAWDKFPQALDFLQQLDRLEPQNPLVMNALACVLVRLGRMPEALYYHKLALATADRSPGLRGQQWAELDAEFCDFHDHLSLWREDSGLLSARRAWESGDVDMAIRSLWQFQKVRDPRPNELYTLYSWLMMTARLSGALQVSVELNRFHGQTAYHQQLAADVLFLLGDEEALQQTLPQALAAESLEHQWRALALAERCLDSGLPVISRAEIDRRIDSAWQAVPICTQARLPATHGATGENLASIGIFLDHFHANSPSIWLLPMLHELNKTRVNIQLYVENADHWGMQRLRDFNVDVIDTSSINELTLQTVIQRNRHHVVWCASGFGDYSRVAMLVAAHPCCVGVLWDQRHLACPGQSHCWRAGFWRVMPSGNEARQPTFTDMAIVAEPDGVGREGHQEPGTLIIALALRPHQLKPCAPMLEGLLGLSRVALSFDHDLLGETGEAILGRLLENSGDVEGRLFLHEAKGYLEPEHVRQHLLSVDCYLSLGTPVYDTAALSLLVPTLAIPGRVGEDFAVMRGLLGRHEPEGNNDWCPSTTDAVIDTLKGWTDPEQWLDAQADFRHHVDQLSQPVSNMQILLQVVDRFIAQAGPEHD